MPDEPMTDEQLESISKADAEEARCGSCDGSGVVRGTEETSGGRFQDYEFKCSCGGRPRVTPVSRLVAEVRRLREALSNLVEASAWTHGKIVEGVGVVYPIGDAVKEARAALPPAKKLGGG